MKPRNPMYLSHENLITRLRYDPLTGLWADAKSGKPRGFLAPGSKRRGAARRFISISRKVRVASARLAWFYMTGTWPSNEVDHIDRDALNDAWDNLRDVPSAVNKHNMYAYRNSKTGIKGVFYEPNIRCRKKYVVRIRRFGQRYYLGNFSTAEEGRRAYEEADKRLDGVLP